MEHPWLNKYPLGVAHEINLYDYPSLLELFEESFRKFSDRIAFENMGGTLTYRQVDEQSRNFAAFLQEELGMKKGERIAIQMPNLLQFPIAFLGAFRAGLI